MTFENFTRRLETIGMLQEKADKISEFLDNIFDISKAFVNTFNSIEEKLIKDLAKELCNDNEEELIDMLYFIIYDTCWCTDKSMNIEMFNSLKKSDLKFDATVYNCWLFFCSEHLHAAKQLSFKLKDTFDNPKYSFIHGVK